MSWHRAPKHNHKTYFQECTHITWYCSYSTQYLPLELHLKGTYLPCTAKIFKEKTFKIHLIFFFHWIPKFPFANHCKCNQHSWFSHYIIQFTQNFLFQGLIQSIQENNEMYRSLYLIKYKPTIAAQIYNTFIISEKIDKSYSWPIQDNMFGMHYIPRSLGLVATPSRFLWANFSYLSIYQDNPSFLG